ncbi:helix-turn-helix domain-containing protein [Trichothermofontia sp.]
MKATASTSEEFLSLPNLPHASATSSGCTAVRFDNLVMSIQSQDIDELSQAVRFWDQEYQRLQPGVFTGKLQQVHIGGIQLLRATWSQALLVRGQCPPGTIAFGIHLLIQGRAIWRNHGCDLRHLLINPDREVALKATAGYEIAVITVEKVRLQEQIQQFCPSLGNRWQNQSVLQPEPKRLQALATYLREFFDWIKGHPHSLSQSSLPTVLVQDIFSLLLNAIASTVDQPPLRPYAAKRIQLVKQAEALVNANPHRPLTLAALCQALRTSERTLTYSFQDVFDMSPMAYFKAQRLNGVHRHLKVANPEEAKVKEIALQWGFQHMGHFSQDYKAMFNESPSQTLRRSRRGAAGES